MHRVRLLAIAVLLIWPPLSGALASAVGATLVHHHCSNVWHGHDQANVVEIAADGDCANHLDTDLYNCNDCHIALAAIPQQGPALLPPERPAFAVVRVQMTAPSRTPSFFRPPIL